MKHEMGIAFLGIGKDPLDIGLRHVGLPSRADGFLERTVAFGVEFNRIRTIGVLLMTGFQDGVQLTGADPGPGHHRGHLLFFDHLPVDELFNIGMVQVQTHHFGGPPGGAAGFDCTRRPVSDPEEGHQPGRFSSTRQRLVFSPEPGKVGSGARPVFEQAGLADPQVHNSPVVDEVVIHGLDEAGVDLRPFVGVLGQVQFLGLGIDEKMTLRGAGDAVGIMQARIEPLR